MGFLRSDLDCAILLPAERGTIGGVRVRRRGVALITSTSLRAKKR
jgi:hypothetical protein